MTGYLVNLYNKTVIGNARITLLVLACLFTLFAYYTKDFRLDASTDSLLLENDRDLQRFREITGRYENQEYVFIAFKPNHDLFSTSTLNTIASLRDELSALAMVDSVLSLVDVPLLTIAGGQLMDAAENYKTLLDIDIDREKAKRELLSSPMYLDQVVSKDGETTAIWIFLERNIEFEQLRTARSNYILKQDDTGLTTAELKQYEQVQSEYDVLKYEIDQKTHDLIIDVRDLISSYTDHGELYFGGVPMVVDDMISFIKNDLVVFGTGIFIFMVVMLGMIFRRLRWILLPMASCIFAVTLMIGLLGIIGWNVTIISSNFVALMLILTLSMNVHLMVRYRQMTHDHPEKNKSELVIDLARKMVWPCLYTALTTMMGFASLVVSGIKPVIDFGWMMTLGLSLIFFTSFLLFPALLALLEKLQVTGKEMKELHFTTILARLTANHRIKILLCSVLLAMISLYGVTNLRVENSYVNYFDDSTDIYKGLKLIDEELGGTLQLDILLHLEDETLTADPAEDDLDEIDALFADIETDKADYWFTPERIDLIKGIHDYLESLAPVGKVLSLASTVRVAEDLIKAGEFDTFFLGVIYRQMSEDLRDELITPYVNVEDDELRITLRVRDSLKDLRRDELIQKIRSDITNRFELSEERVELNGLMVLYNNMLQSLFQSQIMTLGMVMLGIAAMLMILFRSVSLAIIGIIPNALAAMIILGLMGLLNIPLDMMTITIAAITIGIAVDDCIHYIYRFREEYGKHGDYVQTMHYCHASIGRAMFYTSIIIITGFSILVMSNFIPTIYFGLLTTLAMFIAMIAGLTLLPSLILLWKPF